MKKIIVLVVALAVLGGAWVVVSRLGTDLETVEPVVAARPAAEQGFLDSVLESPEVLDGAAGQAGGQRYEASQPEGQAGSPRYKVTLPTGKERHLLSDVEKPPTLRPLEEPVAADSLHFREDYASLRTDAVRNPNSPENRAGVVSLMEARQRRLGQK